VISAAAASASSDGCLRKDRTSEILRKDRTPPIYGVNHQPPGPFEFQVQLPGGINGNLTLAPHKILYSDHPLDRRGWALQENLLATRKLVFSSYELLVDCREHIRRPLRESYVQYKYSRFENEFPLQISTWNWNSTNCISQWFQLILEYFERDLTDSNDRLNAFQGISDEVQEHTGREVRYGVSEILSATLLWTVFSPARSRSDKAPSWSWGCLDTAVGGAVHSEEPEPAMKFSSCDDFAVIITRRIINGATLTRDPLGYNCSCIVDHEEGFPEPGDRSYLRFYDSLGNEDCGLVLETAGIGDYRRIGFFATSNLVDLWPTEPQEITLV
jgi:hypothetical protein